MDERLERWSSLEGWRFRGDRFALPYSLRPALKSNSGHLSSAGGKCRKNIPTCRNLRENLDGSFEILDVARFRTSAPLKPESQVRCACNRRAGRQHGDVTNRFRSIKLRIQSSYPPEP